jgi:hypothetical protein
MSAIPILLVGGLSGAGKSWLSDSIEAEFGFLQYRIDLPGPSQITALGLRHVWNEFFSRHNGEQLADELSKRAKALFKPGVVLSLPGTAYFTAEHLTAARAAGLRPLVLFGSSEECLAVFLQREGPSGLDANHWHRNNDHLYAHYDQAIYSDVRISMFRPDGSRLNRQEALALVHEHLVSG